MSSSTKIRAAIKKILEPFLAKEGFVGKYPNYRRKESGQLQLLSIIYDKWGGGFCLEFSNHPAGDLKTDWGEIVPEEKLEIGYAAIDARARLLSSETLNSNVSGYDNFFRYEEFFNNKEKCEELVQEVVALFPQVNDFLKMEKVGNNISLFQ